MPILSIEDYQLHLIKWQEEWDRAELYLKIAENICLDAVNPAISELRYSGRRLAEFVKCLHTDEPSHVCADRLRDAIADCYRAQHDAMDATVAYSVKTMMKYLKHFGDAVVFEQYPDFYKLYQRVIAIQKRCEESRQDRLNREKIYSHVFSEDFPSMVDSFREFNQKMMESRQQIKHMRQFMAGREIAVALSGLAVFIAILYFLRVPFIDTILSALGLVGTLFGALVAWIEVRKPSIQL